MKRCRSADYQYAIDGESDRLSHCRSPATGRLFQSCGTLRRGERLAGGGGRIRRGRDHRVFFQFFCFVFSSRQQATIRAGWRLSVAGTMWARGKPEGLLADLCTRNLPWQSAANIILGNTPPTLVGMARAVTKPRIGASRNVARTLTTSLKRSRFVTDPSPRSTCDWLFFYILSPRDFKVTIRWRLPAEMGPVSPYGPNNAFYLSDLSLFSLVTDLSFEVPNTRR